MSLLYSFVQAQDGSYKLTSDEGNNYLIYFSEYLLPDADNNTHIVFNVGFSKNAKHSTDIFTGKFDGKSGQL